MSKAGEGCSTTGDGSASTSSGNPSHSGPGSDSLTTGVTTAGASASPSAPGTGGSTSNSPAGSGEPWRVGRSVGRTLYRQRGEDPAKGDELVGVASTRESAGWIVDALNGAAQHRFPAAMSLGRLVYLESPGDLLTDFVAAMDTQDLARRVAAALKGTAR